ncbi:MAG: ABC transporter ATP-binding protein [Rhodospirillales bacterium]|nr:ABC transporter ATP-binding protein [Rhodospirillales bacterium]
MNAVLEIEDLRIGFGPLEAVRGIDLVVERGQTHCLVGESGCGKSVSALSVLRLLPKRARFSAARLAFEGNDIAGLGERGMARLRGDRMAMIFQEPMTSLNPAYTIGSQMIEVLRRHRGASRAAAVDRCIAMLERVGVTAPAMRLGQFPHQLSGGLRQRVMIATALLCEPALLIADEPTTALDVTVQAQFLRLLADIQRQMGLAVLLITHDLGVVARVADRVSVMYAGRIVEHGATGAVFAAPRHPYTRGLLASIPVPGKIPPGGRLGSIPGIVPRIGAGFAGCAFRARCAVAMPACAAPVPEHRLADGHRFACHLGPDGAWSGA